MKDQQEKADEKRIAQIIVNILTTNKLNCTQYSSIKDTKF